MGFRSLSLNKFSIFHGKSVRVGGKGGCINQFSPSGCLSEFPPITPGSSSHGRITEPQKVMLAKLTVAVEGKRKEFAAGKNVKHVFTASLHEPGAPHKTFPRANITLQWSPLAEPLMRPNWSDRVCLCTLASLSYPN